MPLVSASLWQGLIICGDQRYWENEVVGSRGAFLLVSFGASELLGAFAVGGVFLFLLSGQMDKAGSGFWAAIRKFHPYFTGMPLYSSYLRDKWSHLNIDSCCFFL